MTKLKKSEIDDNKIKIIHKMADGTIRGSIKGYKIPYNEKTAIAYKILERWLLKSKKKLI